MLQFQDTAAPALLPHLDKRFLQITHSISLAAFWLCRYVAKPRTWESNKHNRENVRFSHGIHGSTNPCRSRGRPVQGDNSGRWWRARTCSSAAARQREALRRPHRSPRRKRASSRRALPQGGRAAGSRPGGWGTRSWVANNHSRAAQWSAPWTPRPGARGWERGELPRRRRSRCTATAMELRQGSVP